MGKFKEFDIWLQDRPEVIQTMARKYPPWFHYRLKPTGQHCELYSYSEDGTVTVGIIGHDKEMLNQVAQVTRLGVFGIDPNDLEILEETVQ